MEQHVHSVKGRTSGFPGFPEKSCFSWLIYNIGYGKFRMEQSLVRDHGACHIRNHSHRSCIDEEIAFLQCVLQRSVIIHLMKDHLTFCHMRYFFCHGSSTFPVTAGRTCKNMDLFCTLQGGLAADCHSGTADAHNGDGASFYITAGISGRLGKSITISIKPL